jgi:short-subunit dehydrogenase
MFLSGYPTYNLAKGTSTPLNRSIQLTSRFKVTMAATRLTWLITGASSGLGKYIASEALKAGNKVIGATRDVSKAETTYPEFSAKGGIWVRIDPAQNNAYDQVSKYSREHQVDLLVNSAGYAFIGGVEDTRSVSETIQYCCTSL